MTRSALTMESPLTGNFRGADVSAVAQADAPAGARRLSDGFGKCPEIRLQLESVATVC